MRRVLELLICAVMVLAVCSLVIGATWAGARAFSDSLDKIDEGDPVCNGLCLSVAVLIIAITWRTRRG